MLVAVGVPTQTLVEFSMIRRDFFVLVDVFMIYLFGSVIFEFDGMYRKIYHNMIGFVEGDAFYGFDPMG